jgi:hypothetical protein
VQQPLTVNRAHAEDELPGHLHRPLGRKVPDASQQARQVLAVDVLHAQSHRAVGIDDIEHAADVRVRDASRRSHFSLEPAARFGILRKLSGRSLSAIVSRSRKSSAR